jgi:hypothetical protein
MSNKRDQGFWLTIPGAVNPVSGYVQWTFRAAPGCNSHCSSALPRASFGSGENDTYHGLGGGMGGGAVATGAGDSSTLWTAPKGLPIKGQLPHTRRRWSAVVWWRLHRIITSFRGS